MRENANMQVLIKKKKKKKKAFDISAADFPLGKFVQQYLWLSWFCNLSSPQGYFLIFLISYVFIIKTTFL